MPVVRLVVLALVAAGCSGAAGGKHAGAAGAASLPEEIQTTGPVAKAASRLEEVGDRLKETTRRFARTTPASYGHLDLGWYATASGMLQRSGYVELGDIEDLDHNETNPTARVLIRVLRGPDGATMAGLFHYWDTRPEMQRFPVNDIRVLDLETELSDGSFVVTTNMPGQAELDMGPMIDRRLVVSNVPADLAQLHAQHLADYRTRNPELHPVALATIEDVIRSQQRMQMVKGKYRQEMEIPFSEDELNNATENRFQSIVRVVSDELRRRFPSLW